VLFRSQTTEQAVIESEAPAAEEAHEAVPSSSVAEPSAASQPITRRMRNSHTAEDTPAKKQRRGWGASEAMDEDVGVGPDTLKDILDGTVVEPAQPPAAKISVNGSSLRIDGFVRPFRKDHAKELLEAHGEVLKFWMDAIKTHCYVSFSNNAAASAAAAALNGIRWPTTSTSVLSVRAATDQEVDDVCAGTVASVRLPRAPAEPVAEPVPETEKSQSHEQKPQEPTRELDSIFRKTSFKPQLFYLPLNEAQAAQHQKEKLKGPAALRTVVSARLGAVEQDSVVERPEDSRGGVRDFRRTDFREPPRGAADRDRNVSSYRREREPDRRPFFGDRFAGDRRGEHPNRFLDRSDDREARDRRQSRSRSREGRRMRMDEEADAASSKRHEGEQSDRWERGVGLVPPEGKSKVAEKSE